MIKIRNICKSFGSKVIFAGVNLDINHGEQVAVIGPSGCGKSTLLRLLLGLSEPDSGSVEIFGNDMAKMTEGWRNRVRRKMGIVFQSSALFDSMTVGENVGFMLMQNRKTTNEQMRARVAKVLTQVGMEGTEELMPAELSGGMQKRVSIARAIAHEPKMILYDEPTTGLDPQLSTDIEDLMNQLTRELSITSILVTHQISTIMRSSERIIMLDNGKLIEAGSPAEIRSSPSERIRNFINGKNQE